MPDSGAIERRRFGGVERWRVGDPIGRLQDHLRTGGLLAIPTESSYGLAVDPRQQIAVDRVYEVKGRPPQKALPVVVADADQAFALGVPEAAPGLDRLLACWPAPLTAVLPISNPLPASGGERTLAIRIPAHPVLRRLLRDIGFGLTATSANRSGEAAIVGVDNLELLLAGQPAIIVDGGDLPGGSPSTVVRWANGQLDVLRQGAFPLAASPILERKS